MDPFLGLGSSAVAAAGLGVDFIGVEEIDEHYLVEAIARVKRRNPRGRRVNLTQRRQGPQRGSPLLRVRFAPLREPHSLRTLNGLSPPRTTQRRALREGPGVWMKKD